MVCESSGSRAVVDQYRRKPPQQPGVPPDLPAAVVSDQDSRRTPCVLDDERIKSRQLRRCCGSTLRGRYRPSPLRLHEGFTMNRKITVALGSAVSAAVLASCSQLTVDKLEVVGVHGEGTGLSFGLANV